ncbi:MAG: class I SAM-dependent methyltransferase [Thermoleophilaceae bacterium]|nr:class I SAM-dependent methyltransferase [Thermoleophilaceae bacterium]
MPQVCDRAFAAIYDPLFAGLERSGLSALRREQLAGAGGETLEVGAGTGLNLEHYPATVTRLVLSEPEPAMAKNLRRRAEDDPRSPEVVIAPGEALPFPDASFQTVTASLMLCTAPDPGAVLVEIARVLRPRGRYLFLEHVRAHEGERRASWQDRLERPWSLFAGGCHPNRETAALLRSSPLTVERLDQIEMPRIAGPLVRPAIIGSAIRPAER